MTYWVEYSFQKGIRENLMTCDITKARRIVMNVMGERRGNAAVFDSSRAELPLGSIMLCPTKKVFVWIPYGKKGTPKRINRDGSLRRGF